MTTAIRPLTPPRRRRPAVFPCLQRGANPPRHWIATRRQNPTRTVRAVAYGVFTALIMAGPAIAEPRTAAHDSGTDPRKACLEAARSAEIAQELPRGLLVSIALAESGLHAHALNIGGRAYYPNDRAEARRLLLGARKGASVMAGCVQVNARVHARGDDWPLDPRAATLWAAAKLRRHYTETGDWAEAIRRWNGGASRTADNLVCRVRAKMQAVATGPNVLAESNCPGFATARVRRDGEALLELAEAP
jgi:hypothetical protein